MLPYQSVTTCVLGLLCLKVRGTLHTPVLPKAHYYSKTKQPPGHTKSGPSYKRVGWKQMQTQLILRSQHPGPLEGADPARPAAARQERPPRRDRPRPARCAPQRQPSRQTAPQPETQPPSRPSPPAPRTAFPSPAYSGLPTAQTRLAAPGHRLLRRRGEGRGRGRPPLPLRRPGVKMAPSRPGRGLANQAARSPEGRGGAARHRCGSDAGAAECGRQGQPGPAATSLPRHGPASPSPCLATSACAGRLGAVGAVLLKSGRINGPLWLEQGLGHQPRVISGVWLPVRQAWDCACRPSLTVTSTIPRNAATETKQDTFKCWHVGCFCLPPLPPSVPQLDLFAHYKGCV